MEPNKATFGAKQKHGASQELLESGGFAVARIQSKTLHCTPFPGKNTAVFITNLNQMRFMTNFTRIWLLHGPWSRNNDRIFHRDRHPRSSFWCPGVRYLSTIIFNRICQLVHISSAYPELDPQAGNICQGIESDEMGSLPFAIVWESINWGGRIHNIVKSWTNKYRDTNRTFPAQKDPPLGGIVKWSMHFTIPLLGPVFDPWAWSIDMCIGYIRKKHNSSFWPTSWALHMLIILLPMFQFLQITNWHTRMRSSRLHRQPCLKLSLPGCRCWLQEVHLNWKETWRCISEPMNILNISYIDCGCSPCLDQVWIQWTFTSVFYKLYHS